MVLSLRRSCRPPSYCLLPTSVPFIFANKPPLDYFSSVMSIALLTAAVSKDKQEDEMVRQMRLTAFFSAFVFVVGFVAVQPVVMTAVGSDGEYLTAHFAVLMMLLSYHYTFYSMKRRARRE